MACALIDAAAWQSLGMNWGSLTSDPWRAAALERAIALQRNWPDGVPWKEIAEGFEFRGKRYFLASKAEGIYKPMHAEVALSIKSTVPRGSRENIYSDQLSTSSETFLYDYKRRGGPDNTANRSLREAMKRQEPLIWFWGLRPGVYEIMAPTWVVQDRRAVRKFEVVPAYIPRLGEATQLELLASSPFAETQRGYTTREARVRLHQRTFRTQVLDAYQHRCAMCSIKFDELLEAAHIIPDSAPDGEAVVPNALALCNLHHAAFDRLLVDVDDDFRIVLSDEFQRRTDGPIFQQAFLERAGERIHLPKRPADRPPLAAFHRRRQILRA